MKIVLPDTNIILWTFNGGIDFREAIARVAPDYEIKIPTCVINELKKLKTKQSIAALAFCSKIFKNCVFLAIVSVVSLILLAGAGASGRSRRA